MNLDDLRARLRVADANAQFTPSWNLDSGGGIGSLHLYGVVGGFWGDGIVASDIVPAIRDLDVATLNVYVNSPGGDVYDAIAIRNALRQHPAHVVVTVDGIAASAASFIACAGDEVVMGENAELMIHDAWTIALGNAEDMRTVADDLDRVSDNIAAMYAAKAGGDAAEWRAVMKAETWYSAAEAVAAGLADRLHSDEPVAAPAAAKFDLSMFAHAGRGDAPAPFVPAAMATHREKEIRMNRAQLLAALNAGTITPEQYSASIATLNAMEGGELEQPTAQPVAVAVGQAPGVPVAAEYQAGPTGAPAPAARTEDRPMSGAQHIAAIRDAARSDNKGDLVRAFQNALSPVLITDDAGEGFNRPQWLGELWQAETGGRPYIESLGGPRPLLGTRIEGWTWDDVPDAPQPYAGELAEVPTGTWSTKPVSQEPDRWAWGNKVDRIVRDLGSDELIRSLFAKIGAGYDAKSDQAVGADLLAAATVLTGATTALGAFTKAAIALKKIGARATSFWVSENVFEAFTALKVSDLPAWLANQSGFVDLAEGNASITSLVRIDADFDLPADTVLAYDRRAATVFESPQINVEAIDINRGGIDIGFFAYGGTLVNDARAIVKLDLTP